MSLFSQNGTHCKNGRAGKTHPKGKNDDFSAKMEENLGHSPTDQKKTHTIRTVILIVAAAIALLALLGVITISIWTKAPDTKNSSLIVQATPTPAPHTDPTATPEPTTEPSPTEKPLRNEDVYTLLVVGRDQVGLNTDTIMVVQMDCRNHTANVVSIPRDTLVNVPRSIK